MLLIARTETSRMKASLHTKADSCICSYLFSLVLMLICKIYSLDLYRSAAPSLSEKELEDEFNYFCINHYLNRNSVTFKNKKHATWEN